MMHEQENRGGEWVVRIWGGETGGTKIKGFLTIKWLGTGWSGQPKESEGMLTGES